MTTRLLLANGAIDLRLGDWRTALADVETCDAVITDPPYTSRVALGYRSGNHARKTILDGTEIHSIDYAAIDRPGAEEVARWAVSVARDWVVAFNDHIGWHWLADEMERANWYVFAPVVWLRRNAPPRFQGDGPNDAAEYLAVARPRRVTKCGHINGYYDVLVPSNRTAGGADPFIRIGQKPLALMRAIVRDYTKPGDLVVDPFCGGGTTALACAMEGRRCITSEIDPETFEKARARLARGHTPDMFATEAK